jgi:phage-related protein
MPSVSIGAFELRIHDADGQYRVFYAVASEKGILVFHAFAKKTRKTPHSEILLARKRWKEMQDEG